MSAAHKDDRKRDLARIHCLKKELDLDDETYRSMLWTVARVQSAAKLDSHGRRQVIEHMRARQQQSPGGRGRGYPGRHSRVDLDPQLGKIEALLTDMHLPWSYADAIAKRVAGVPRVAWVRSPDKLRAIIAALGYEQQKRDALDRIDELLKELGMTREQLQRQRGLKTGWDRNPVGLATAREFLEEILHVRREDKEGSPDAGH